jgi:hypothetical protein
MHALISVCIIAALTAMFSFFVMQLNLATDFKTFYLSSKALQTTQSPYEILYTLNLNTPLFIILSKPVAYFGYQHAFILWQLFSLSLLLATVYMIFRLFPNLPNPSIYLFFCPFPVLINVFLGQLGFLVCFLLVLGVYLNHTQKTLLAGLCWSFLIALKLNAALLFLYPLYFRKYGLFLSLIVCTVSLLLLPIVLGYATLYHQYFKALDYIYWYGSEWNLSFFGFIYRLLFSYYPSYQDLMVAKRWVMILSFSALSLFVYWLWFRIKSLESTALLSVLSIAMLLFSPLGWIYYAPTLFLPIAYCLNQWHRLDRKHSTLLCTALILIFWPIPEFASIPLQSWWYKLSVVGFGFYGLCLLLYFICSMSSNQSVEKSTTGMIWLAYITITVNFLMLMHSVILYLGQQLLS